MSEDLRELEWPPLPRAQGPPMTGGAGHVDVGQSARPTIVAFRALLPALAAIAVGLLVLLGWVSGSATLRAFLPGALPMKASAAFLLVLLGVVLAVLATASATASATALEYATRVDLGIDRLLGARTWSSPAPGISGRMAVPDLVRWAIQPGWGMGDAHG